MESDPDLVLAQALVEGEFCTQDQLRQALGEYGGLATRGVLDWFGSFLIDRGFLSAQELRDVLRCINGSVWQCKKCMAGHLVLLEQMTETPRCEQCDGELGAVEKRDTKKPRRADRFTASILRIANPNRFDAGEKVGAYEILDVVGEGGMAVVYRAHDRLLHREVALKIFYTQGRTAIQDRERFFLECQLISRLKHPNIVQIYDWGSEGEIHYYAMYLVQGRSLKEIIEHEPADPRQAVGWIETVARAAHYAHTEGVIHRDLKPANVVLGDDGDVRILDFGLAKAVGHEFEAFRESAPVGTPRYMAPEQLKKTSDDVDARTDVYGIGTILYELLTAERLFTYRERPELFDKIRNQPPAPPRAKNPAIPPAIEQICLKALAKKKADRFQSALEMAEAIRKFLAIGGPSSGRRPAAGD